MFPHLVSVEGKSIQVVFFFFIILDPIVQPQLDTLFWTEFAFSVSASGGAQF